MLPYPVIRDLNKSPSESEEGSTSQQLSKNKEIDNKPVKQTNPAQGLRKASTFISPGLKGLNQLQIAIGVAKKDSSSNNPTPEDSKNSIILNRPNIVVEDEILEEDEHNLIDVLKRKNEK